jgi:hypothetical protein
MRQITNDKGGWAVSFNWNLDVTEVLISAVMPLVGWAVIARQNACVEPFGAEMEEHTNAAI